MCTGILCVDRGGSRNSLGGGGCTGPEFFKGGVGYGPGPQEFSYTDKQNKKKENL